jgi:hypothetical protein
MTGRQRSYLLLNDRAERTPIFWVSTEVGKKVAKKVANEIAKKVAKSG